MSRYGLVVYPKDGGAGVDISNGSKACAYRGFFDPEFDQNGETWSYPDLSPGASLFIVPRRTVAIIQTGAVPRVISCSGVQISGNTVHAWFDGFNSSQDKGRRPIEFDAFQVSGAGGVPRFGLQLIDATDYSEINDLAVAGKCVWRGVVNVFGAWTIPNIPDRANALVFAYWDRGDRAVDFDRENMTINVYREAGNDVISDGSADCLMWICIFSNGSYPVPPQYGLAIWNAAGQCTFSSDNAPMLYRGNSLNTQRIPGNYAYPVTASAKPMVPLCRLGVHDGMNLSNNYLDYRHAGMRMAGGGVTAWRTKYINSYDHSKINIQYRLTTINLPVLDATDYFSI
ncbi:hypothetical protein FOT80_27685 [Serratia fonticola]|nr:hypothetical protein [Serratia fonticola]